MFQTGMEILCLQVNLLMPFSDATTVTKADMVNSCKRLRSYDHVR